MNKRKILENRSQVLFTTSSSLFSKFLSIGTLEIKHVRIPEFYRLMATVDRAKKRFQTSHKNKNRSYFPIPYYIVYIIGGR